MALSEFPLQREYAKLARDLYVLRNQLMNRELTSRRAIIDLERRLSMHLALLARMEVTDFSPTGRDPERFLYFATALQSTEEPHLIETCHEAFEQLTDESLDPQITTYSAVDVTSFYLCRSFFMYNKTEFGSGRVANQIYTIGSAVWFSITIANLKYPPQSIWLIPPLAVTTIIGIVFGLLILVVANRFAKHHKQSNQKLRDQRAQLILEQAILGLAHDYSLYLRSFSTTGKMLTKDTSLHFPGIDLFRDHENLFVDLETVFAEVLEIYLPVVTLGTPGEFIGAGRVETDDRSWKDALEVLAENAVLILVLPSTGLSLFWEIEWIKQRNYLSKTMFIMPPIKAKFLRQTDKSITRSWDDIWQSLREKLGSTEIKTPQDDVVEHHWKDIWHKKLENLDNKGIKFPSNDNDELPWKDIWQSLRENLDDKGIKLPPYDPNGMIFFLSADGTVSMTTSLGGSLQSKQIENHVKSLLQMKGGN